MLGDFARGARYVVRGARLLTRPGIRRFVAVPALVSVLMLTTTIGLVLYSVNGLMAQWLPSSLSWLGWLIWPVVVVLFLGLGVLGAGLVANIIAAPFNSDLARAVFLTLRDSHTALPPTRPWPNDAIAAVRFEVQRLLFGLKWFVPTSLVALIPGAGVLASVLTALVAAWTLALQYLDYPLALQHLSFEQQRKIASSHRPLTLGFGTAVALLHMIPFANLLAMPIAVAGATALWYERLRAPE